MLHITTYPHAHEGQNGNLILLHTNLFGFRMQLLEIIVVDEGLGMCLTHLLFLADAMNSGKGTICSLSWEAYIDPFY